MKKFFAIALAVAMFASMATVASAAENTTTLTTEVPAATYTLNIPVDQEVPYGTTSMKIGEVTITDSSNFAVGKNVSVTITYDKFTSTGVTTTIPFEVEMVNRQYYSSYKKEMASGESIIFKGTASGTVGTYATEWFETNTVAAGGEYAKIEDCYIKFYSSDWGKALAGEYTATITFTAEVVVE